jgi:hypothetical protein
MSLIHWWPLGENKNDIVGGAHLSGTYATSGKGKISAGCASEWGTRLSTSTSNLTGLKNFSIAMWVRLDSAANSNAWSDLFGMNMQKGSTTESLRAEVNSTGGNALQLYCNNISGTSGGAANFTLTKDTWQHLVITKNGARLTSYINGSIVNYTDWSNITDAYCTGEFHLSDGGFYCSYNDVRLYNHVLSTKEIKELSKALVLHYPLTTPINTKAFTITVNDWQPNKDASGATNGAGSATLQSDGSVLVTSNNQNTRLRWGTFPYLTAGQKYTVSIKYKQVSGNQTFRWQIQERSTAGGGSVYETYWTQDTQKEIQLKDGWKIIYYHLTIKNNCYGMFWIQEGEDYAHYTQQYYLKDFCVEKGHTTSPGSNTASTTIGDSSGLGNDGTLTLPDYYETVYDSQLGRNTLHSKGHKDAFIHTQLVPSFINGTGTICFWYKKDSASTNFLVATPYQGSGSGTYLWANQPNSTPWNGGTTSYGSWYIDGIERKSNVESNTDWHFYCITGVNISAWSSFAIHDHGDDGWLYRGKIADFRVYNTILSAADIKELYNVGWAANRQGQAFSNVLNEGQSKFQITRSGVNNCLNIQETGCVPEGYQPLHYLYSADRSRCIDTGATFNLNTDKVEIDFQSADATGNYFIAGCGVGGTNAPYLWIYQYPSGSTFSIYADTGSGQKAWHSGNQQDANRHVVILDKRIMYYDGTSRANNSAVSFSNNLSNFCLFDSCTSGSGYSAKVKIYSCKIWHSGVLVRKLIPVKRKSDGALGFFDTVGCTFYGETAGRSLVAGPQAVSQSRDGSLYCAEFNEI